jgi:uncharacterized protein
MEPVMPDEVVSIHVDFNVPAVMRDGTVLRANVYRPTGDGRWPVLLTRLPYGKDFPHGAAVMDPVQVTRRGYVVIIQDTRGTNASDGNWYPMIREADDGVDTVAWAAALPNADGHVGMFGLSYFGFTQWAAALQQPPALKAMAPMVTWCDPLNGLWARGGAFELGTVAAWMLHMGIGVVFRRDMQDPQVLGSSLAALTGELDALGCSGYWDLPLAEFGPLCRQPVAPAFFDSIANLMDRTAPLLAAARIQGRHDLVQVPTFNVGGWYDILQSSTIEHFVTMQRQGKPAKLLMGPWTHGRQTNPVGELNFGMASEIGLINLQADLTSMQLRWFDHWLKGIDTGLMQEAPIKLFVMGANVWRDEWEWPLARAEDTRLYLRAGGGLSLDPPGEEVPDSYIYNPADPVPTRGGPLLMPPEYPAGPYDQRSIEARPDVLVYSTAPLANDVEVTGPITVQLWAVSSAPDTDFVARLTDVYPDGRSINLVDGIVRARYRGFAQGQPPSLIEPGCPYAYEIDLWSTSNLFRAGHRIRLQITSSCFPRWDRNPNTGDDFGVNTRLQPAHQAILHDREHPSHVVVPIVGAA